jgi:hypothetical protein
VRDIMPKSISAFFDDVSENMIRSFEGWDKHIPQEGEKGGLRERRVRDFLANYLPSKYGVASGHIIDSGGEVSLQEDVVIFDRVNCPVLKADPYYHVFPCESVFATVEVKSVLDAKAVAECVSHTHRLRELHRGHESALGHVESFVFAYDSYGSRQKQPVDWAMDRFREIALAENQLRPVPSLVLCLKKKFVLHLGGPDGESMYIPDMLKSGILLYFLEKMLHRLSQVQTSLPLFFTNYGWWGRDNPIIRSPNTWNLTRDAK